MKFLRREQWVRKRSRRRNRESNIHISFETEPQIAGKSDSSCLLIIYNTTGYTGWNPTEFTAKQWERMYTWVVYKSLILGGWAITAAIPPCNHLVLNELAVFIATLPVNPTNMHWDHVCSQWGVQWEGLGPKLNMWRPHRIRKTSQPERLIRGYPP